MKSCSVKLLTSKPTLVCCGYLLKRNPLFLNQIHFENKRMRSNTLESKFWKIDPADQLSWIGNSIFSFGKNDK